jgi:hypothetical protein
MVDAPLSPFWSAVDCAGDAGLGHDVRPGALTPAQVRSTILAPLLARRPPPDARAADLLHALALLWHDRLEAAHELVQSREGDAEADLLHAVLHRREGDYGNARYWFAAVGTHALFGALAPSASSLGLVDGSGAYAPALMVEAVRAACAGQRPGAPLMALQRLEFAVLAELLQAR